ncbi:MAG: hypothetical protein UHK60_10170 [Acutalibacteraceae bacterium]|nr:hypothetical protein [Acutalibacteraceae bacterium]
MRDFDDRSKMNRESNECYNNYSSNNSAYGGNNDYHVNNSSYNANNSNNHQLENLNRVYMNKTKNSVSSVLLCIAFLSIFALIIISIVVYDRRVNIPMENLFPNLLLVVIFITILSATATPLINGILKRRRCKIHIKADVKDVYTSSGTNGNKRYTYTYQYVYMGKEYVITTTERSCIELPEKGDLADVLINEDNPKDYYIGNKTIERETFLMSIAIVVVVSVWLKIGLANYK